MLNNQFAVPQFIEVESKVIGPISVRQFIILLGTAGIIFVWYEVFSFIIFVILGILTLGIGVVFAFAKVNGQPFHNFILSLIQTLQRPRLAVWQHELHQVLVTKLTRREKKAKEPPVQPKQPLSNSDVTELSLIVDTSGKYQSFNATKPKS